MVRNGAVVSTHIDQGQSQTSIYSLQRTESLNPFLLMSGDGFSHIWTACQAPSVVGIHHISTSYQGRLHSH